MKASYVFALLIESFLLRRPFFIRFVSANDSSRNCVVRSQLNKIYNLYQSCKISLTYAACHIYIYIYMYAHLVCHHRMLCDIQMVHDYHVYDKFNHTLCQHAWQTIARARANLHLWQLLFFFVYIFIYCRSSILIVFSHFWHLFLLIPVRVIIGRIHKSKIKTKLEDKKNGVVVGFVCFNVKSL